MSEPLGQNVAATPRAAAPRALASPEELPLSSPPPPPPNRAPKLYHLLAFRLSVWYGGVVAAAAALCYLTFYLVVVSVMRERTDNYLIGEVLESARMLRTAGVAEMIAELNREVSATGSADVFYRAFNPDGSVLASSDLGQWSDVGTALRAAPVAAEGARPRVENWYGSGHHSRVRVVVYRASPGLTLQLGTTVEDDDRVIRTSRDIVVGIMLLIVAAAVVVGWLMARRTLAGVERVTGTATRIAGGADLESRVPRTGRGDEMDQLADAFNGMLERIQRLVTGMKQTNDNIAHELRSPLTRMRGLAESSFMSEPSPQDYHQLAAETIEECDRLLSVINTMLDIGEAEAGIAPMRLSEVDVGRVAEDACELYGPVADERDVRIELSTGGGTGSGGRCVVRGDVQRLQRAVANLLDNALKYSPAGGVVRFNVAREGGEVVLTISNGGPGISARDLPHVFERFYRGTMARTQRGNGLGLSLTRAVIRAHGGEVTAESVPDQETRMTVRLPAAAGDAGNGTAPGAAAAVPFPEAAQPRDAGAARP